jgi:hypothetical protein
MSGMYAGGRTPAGTNLTILLVAGIATARPAVHQVIIGSDAAPADIATRFNLLRHTVAATGGTPITIRPADPGGTSGLCTALQGTMTEPTYEATPLLEIELNQRATYTWIANPGREIKSPLGTANGVGLRSIASGATPSIGCTIAWDE